MPKYFDIHTHVNFKAFREDGEEVIKRALENNTWLMNVGSQYGTSKRAVEMAQKYEKGVYACVGLHPIHLEIGHHDEEEIDPSFAEASEGQRVNGFMSRAEVFIYEKYLELAKDPKVLAIGECGLDYYHTSIDSTEKQKQVFIEQIKLAIEVGKPLMLHIRNSPPHPTGTPQEGNLSTPSLRATPQEGNNAYADVAEILKNYPNAKAVSHCFAGTVEDMQRFVDIGIYVSFAGPITYKPKPEICDYIAVIKATPLDKILTDTDAPYLAPVPYRGKRNEPVYVREIVKKIAEIKNLPEDEVALAIVANAQKLFGI